MNDTSSRPSSLPGRRQIDDHTHGLFAALGIAIAVMLVLSAVAVKTRAGVYAYVDDVPMRKPIVDLSKELILRDQGKYDPSPEQERAALSLAVNEAIERELVAREARRLRVPVTRELVEQARKGLNERIEAWRPMSEVLEALRLSDEDLRRELEKDVLNRLMHDRIYLDVADATEDEVRRYYDEHLEEFREEEGTRVFAIYVHKPDDPEGQRRARQRTEEARELVAGGAEFRAVSAAVTDGVLRRTGGDLGWVRKGFLPAPMESAVQHLKEGELSDIIETRDGFHVLMVAGRRHYGYTPFEEVRRRIESRLRILAGERSFRHLVHRLRSEARITRYD